MTHRELWKILKTAGWSQLAGGNHDLAVDPKNPNHAIPVPHKHKKKDIPKGTAEAILKQAGLVQKK